MDNFLVLLFCVGVPALIIAVAVYASEQKNKQIREAKAAYEEALDHLRQNPASNEWREAALASGRYYAALAKANKRTMFDEVALMNDLNAIQAAAQPNPAPQADKGDVKTRLANLESLYNDGVITKEEYETRRNEILSEL